MLVILKGAAEGVEMGLSDADPARVCGCGGNELRKDEAGGVGAGFY